MTIHKVDCCRSSQYKDSTLTVHLYPSIRNNKRYDAEGIWHTLFKAHEKVAKVLDLATNIDIIIFESPYVIAEYGFGANTDNFDAITIRLSPDFVDIMGSIQLHMPALLAHELHHACRQRKLPYWDHTTLKDAMISEGLAENFQHALYPKSPLHVNPEVERELKTWEEKARKDANSTTYDYDGWFYGNDTMPRWIGYTIGYHIVRNHIISKNTTAAKAVWAKSSDIKL
jgi:uncharacterized protein YjaZ